MQFRKFEKLGWDVSALGFGAMRFQTKKVGDKDVIDEEIAIPLIRKSIDKGINYVDTAWPYHNETSEIIVGKALKDGYREKVKLVSKSPLWLVQSVKDFENYFNQQLIKLQTDYLDVYLLHGMNEARWKQVQELKILDKMVQLKKEGKIRAIGFSFHDSTDLFKRIIDGFDWDVVQIQFNYVDVQYQAGTEGLEYASKKGIPVIVMEPLRGGRLVSENENLKKIVENYSPKQSLADWALRFVWNFPAVKVVLSGMNSLKMVEENIQTAETAKENSLNQNDFKVIQQLRETFNKYTRIPCTYCSYCMPCPSGVNIPENFNLLNSKSWSPQNSFYHLAYTWLAKDEESLKGSPNNGNASMCTKCNVCLEKCPQNINIPNELDKIYNIFELKKEFSDFY